MSIDQGRTYRLWLKEEANYGVEEVVVASNAIRYMSFGRTHQPHNRVNAPEKNATPGQSRRFDRKPATAGTGLVFNVQPSGALNTLSENDPLFKNALGARTNVTLATTVSSGPTTTSATVASAGALAIGDAVQLEVTGQTGLHTRFLTNVVGAALTWAPALPAAQTVGDDVKGIVTYRLTTAIGNSITALRALPSGKKEALVGWAMDTMSLALDANSEIVATFAGPARDLKSTATSQAAPGSSTFIGTQNPPSGITDGYTMINNVVYLMKSMTIDMSNAVNARNTEYGVRLPTEINRDGIREINVSLDAWSETEATLKDLAEAGTTVSLFNQTGLGAGNSVALYLPKVDFNYPDQDDPMEQITWSFQGVALESVQGANNELSIAFG